MEILGSPVHPFSFPDDSVVVPACSDDYLPKGEDRGKFTLHAIIIHCRPDVPVMSQEGSRKVNLSSVGVFPGPRIVCPVS